MKSLSLTIFLACLFSISAGEKVRFDNYRVHSIKIENESQLRFLQDLENFRDGIEFIHSPVVTLQTVDIIVPPHKFADIAELFESNQIQHEVKIENLQKLIDEEQPQDQVRSDFGWTRYHDLKEIYTWLDELLEKYPDVLKNYTYGRSYENRPLRAVRVSHKKGNPTIFIESTIHAREWVTAATATYFLNELLTSSDEDIQNLAKNYDWVFIPVTNVDGYAYTHSTNRLWRKTRKPTNRFCIGSDPNRNFDFHHASVGASKNPCSETYAGPKPFSEPETLALSEFIKTFNNIKLYISFHSYSQLLLFPYGHSYEHAPNHNDMLQISTKTKYAIAKRYGTKYTVGNIAQTIYLASGSSIDWVYAVQNVSLTYTFEFRDTGRYGFVLPPKQIIPNSLEIIDGLKVLVAEAKALNYL